MEILVVDDHSLIREALRGVLAELQPDAGIVEAANASLALQVLEQRPGVELVLLDLNLPDRPGFELLAELRERFPAVATVVLSALEDRANVVRALDLGAVGFVPKSADRQTMLDAFLTVLAGGIYAPPEILRRTPGEASPAPRTVADLHLTGRQLEVLGLLMLGQSNKAICRELELAEPTVKNHVTAILRELKVTNRTEAVVTAQALGLAPRAR